MKIRVLILAAAVGVTPAQAQEGAFRLDGLVVTGSPTARPADAVAAHVSILDGDELRARGVRRVLDALREVPGVGVVQGGSEGSVTSLFMRGGESDYVLILIDGVQVNQPGGAFDFAGLTLANVERIEVLRGPASALYGSDAIAGVVHVITRTGSTGSRGSLSAAVGNQGRREWTGELSGGTERTGYSIALTRTATDGILAFNNAHRNTVLSATMGFRPDESTSGRVSVRLRDRKYRYPTDGTGAVVDRNSFTFSDESTIGVRLARSLGSVLDLQALVGINATDGGTDDEADGVADTLGFYAFNSLDHVRRTSADLRANLRVAESVVSVGVELEQERQRSFTESFSAFGPSSGRSEYTRWNRGAYVHVARDAGALGVNLGGRLEDNERFGRLGTWQLGAALKVTRGLRLRASAGRAIKEPTFFENFATGFARGNPDLEPETSRSLEAGADAALAGGRVQLGLTAFHQRFGDLIQYTFVPPTPDGPNFFNVARADSRGIEVTASGSAGALAVSGSWTWLSTDVVDSGFDEGPGATFVDGEGLIRRPKHSGNVRFSYRAARGTVSGGIRHVGERADRDFGPFPAEPVILEGYTVVTVGGELEVAEDAFLTVGADNVLDARVEEVFGFRSPGRSLSIGIRVDFGVER